MRKMSFIGFIRAHVLRFSCGILVALVGLVIGSTLYGRAPQCGELFESKATQLPPRVFLTSSTLTPVFDIFMVVRSNAWHYWEWIGQNLSRYFPNENPFAWINDKENWIWITGDPHVLNFGLFAKLTKVFFKVVDKDDMAKGPAFLDFSKFLMSTAALKMKYNTVKHKDDHRPKDREKGNRSIQYLYKEGKYKDFFDNVKAAYVKGLMGTKAPKPKFLDDYIKDFEDNLEKDSTFISNLDEYAQKKMVKNENDKPNFENPELDFEKEELEKFNPAEHPFAQKAFDRSLVFLKDHFNDIGFDVVSTGIKKKSEGGSHDQERLVFLVEFNRDEHKEFAIFELKEETFSSVDYLGLNDIAKDDTLNPTEGLRAWWGDKNVPELYQTFIVEHNDKTKPYWLRARFNNELKPQDWVEDDQIVERQEDLEALQIYIANHMGRKQSEQFEKRNDRTLERLRNLLTDEDNIAKLNKSFDAIFLDYLRELAKKSK